MRALLDRLRAVRVSVFGDFALDAYWDLEPGEGERSLETGLPVRRVRAERYAPGAAGNVCANLAALGVGDVQAVGPVGDDTWGAALRAHLAARGVDVRRLVAPRPDWRTPTYAKPMDAGRELERLDFGTTQALLRRERAALLDRLEEVLRGSRAVVVNQQLEPGACTADVMERLSALAVAYPTVVFLADVRRRDLPVAHMARKTDEPDATGTETYPAFVSRGAEGFLVRAGAREVEVPAHVVPGPVDPVGAGDTAVAALAAALGAGATAEDAARLAVAAAAVTVAKVGETGTASRGEVEFALAMRGSR